MNKRPKLSTLKPRLKTLKTGLKTQSATARVRGNSWLGIRLRKLNECPACEPCMSKGVVTPAVEVDHIVPLERGGHATAWRNLQSICRSCHTEKTAQELKDRLGGKAR